MKQTRWMAVQARMHHGLSGGTSHLAAVISENVGQVPQPPPETPAVPALLVPSPPRRPAILSAQPAGAPGRAKGVWGTGRSPLSTNLASFLALTESQNLPWWQGPALPGVDPRHPSRSSVYRFYRSYNTKYSLAQEPRPGRTGNWSSADKLKFRDWALAQGKFTLDQAHEAAYYLIGKRVHRSRIGKVLAEVGLTRKKRTLIDPRRHR